MTTTFPFLVSVKRILIFSSQWVLANVLIFVSVQNARRFVSDPRGLILLVVLNILWLVPIIGEAAVPENKVRIRGMWRCYNLWMGVMLLDLLVAAYDYSHYRLGQSSTSRFEVPAGLVLICAGFILSFIAWLNIRKYVSPQFQIIEGHRIVDRGVYRWVRHPIYTGFFLIAAGVPILAHSGAGLVALTLIVTPIWLYVIQKEEEFLLANLGKDYGAYMRRTKRLIPFVY
jgi:protein-S-isoprenylcysteine O-methyltransferase Ste14